MRTILAFALLTLAVSGCSSSPRTEPVHPVSGQVLLRERPLTGALVVFHPAEGGKPEGWPMLPNGRTDAEGRFQLSTFGSNDGAPAGSYRVTVTWAPETADGEDPESVESMAVDPTGGRYTSPESGLTAEVKAGDNQLDPFRLP